MKGKRTLALILASGLTAAMGITNVGSLAYAMEAWPYSDVTPDDPAYAYIEDVVDAGIMKGESDTEFGIDEEVTRGEVLTYIYRLMKSPQPAEGSSSSFEDIEGTDYETAVIWADSIGLFDGLDEDFLADGLFHGDEGITREQLAALLMNLAKDQLDIDIQENTLESLEDISDSNDVKDAYIDAVKWAAGNQLIEPDQEQKIFPGNIITKEDVAQALAKLAAMVEDETIDLAIGSETEASESDSTGDNADQGNKSGNTDSTGNADKGTVKHVHNWVANMVTVDVPEKGHTESKLVKEAWTETVNHPEEGHTESQLVKEAWTETIEHPEEGHTEQQKVIDKEAVYETVHHEAEGYYEDKKVIDQEAVYEEVLVSPEEGHWETQKELVSEAWTETINHPAVTHEEQKWVVDVPAWSETITVYDHDFCFVCGLDLTNSGFTIDDITAHMKAHALAGNGGSWGQDGRPATEVVNHPEEGHYETITVVDQEAWTETIEHEAIYKDVQVWVVDKEAVYEQQLVTPEVSHIEKVWVETKPAWDEQVLVSPEESHIEKVWVVDKEAWTETIEHPAEYKDVYVVDKEAWTETIEHPAEYKEVWVVDVPATTTKVQNGYICTGCYQVTGGVVGKG